MSSFGMNLFAGRVLQCQLNAAPITRPPLIPPRTKPTPAPQPTPPDVVTLVRTPKSASVALQEPFEQFLAKDLRKEVSRLKLKLIKTGPDANNTKAGYIALLRKYYAARGNVATITPPKATIAVASASRFQAAKASFTEHEDDMPTIVFLKVLFSAEFWRRFLDLHRCISKTNKLMLSNTVTSPSIDLFGPQQSAAGLKFWEDVARVVNRDMSGSTSCNVLDNGQVSTAESLFETWKRLCALFNGVHVPGHFVPDKQQDREMLHLRKLLAVHTELIPVVRLGDFFSTFEPIVPPEAQGGGESHADSAQLDASQNAEDDFIFVTDDDGDHDSVEQDEPSHRRSSTGPTVSASQAGEDDVVVELKRQFWKHKNKLALQNIANAKLQFRIEQTKFLEERLCGSKRKIDALRNELKVHGNGPDAQSLASELVFFVQERKRALASLAEQSET